MELVSSCNILSPCKGTLICRHYKIKIRKNNRGTGFPCVDMRVQPRFHMKIYSTLSDFSADVVTTLHSILFEDKSHCFKRLANVEYLQLYIHPTQFTTDCPVQFTTDCP